MHRSLPVIFLRRAFSSVVLAVLAIFLSPQNVFADENFKIGLTSRYTVQASGVTIIEQQFTLTNKTPTLYASQYAIEVGSNKISNVKVFDKSGDIPSNIVNTDKKTSIALSFDDVIVGEGKQRQFTVQFESTDIAIISGNVVEVYIPRFSDLARYDSYKVELLVPQQFGRPVRVNPPADGVNVENGFTTMIFQNLGDNGVTTLFGNKQIYDYTLRYHLENPTNSIGLAQIALPPDTSYQKVWFTSLDPQPKEITRDADGNWIATYEVSAGRDAEIVLTGKTNIYLTPQTDFIDPAPTKDHTIDQKFWQTKNPMIQNLAKQHTTPKQIYDYVVNTLQYNYNKVNGPVTRLGAVEAFEQPDQAACQEFTDTFVALARANGLPARRITGYSYTENERLRPLSLVDDVLHAWPEYYDAASQRWVAVDPTWGNTTGGLDYFNQLDFNHFTFAINGVSDSLPYPAGSYKKINEKTKDVEVSFGKEDVFPPLSVQFAFKKKPFWLAPLKNQYEILITNSTGLAWYNLPLQASTDNPAIQINQLQQTVPLLLPYQTISVPLELQNTDWLRRRPIRLTLNLQDLSSTHELYSGIQIIETIKSAPVNPIGLVAGLVVATLITGCLLVFRRKR
jgi:transglutaminase-like putative cysteine protease